MAQSGQEQKATGNVGGGEGALETELGQIAEAQHQAGDSFAAEASHWTMEK